MKKLILFLSFIFIGQNQLAAQTVITDPGTIGTVPERTYNITVTRDDGIAENIPGHAHTGITLEIKIGSTSRSNSPVFAPDVISSRTYNFPVTLSLPGFPPPVRYAKVTFSYPLGLSSGYYALTTTVGDHTTISSDIYYPGQFGYGVALYCIAPNQYTMKVTRFECYLCVPPGGGTTLSKTAISQNDTTLVPNPSNGFSELYYTAIDKETISINVSDMNGKIVNTYSKDIEAGLNKLPIDIQKHLGGTYIVQWKSSTGKSGNLKLMKNK